jgi:hypothetical protein
MPFNSTTVYEVRTSGSSNNGGGYDTSYSGSTLASGTVTSSTVTVTATSAIFTSGMIGQAIYDSSGTRRIIIAYTSTTVVTVDSAPSWTSVAITVGGSGGTDYSQQNSAQATGTATSSTTTVTATTGIFTSNMVGNIISDGTTRKVITGFTSSTVITVDSAPSWTSATIYVGGAVSNLGDIFSLLVAGNKVWIAAGTYSRTTSINTGAVSGSATIGRISIEGYNTTRRDGAARPILTSATSSISIINVSASNFGNIEWVNLKFTHTGSPRGSAIGNGGFNVSTLFFKNCIFDGVLQTITQFSTPVVMEGCEVLNNTSTTAAILLTGSSNVFTGCDFHNNSGDAFRDLNGYGSGNHRFTSCQFTGNGGIGFNSVEAFALVVEFFDCLFVDNTGDAIKLTSAGTNAKTISIANCIFYNNTGFDINNLDNIIKVNNAIRFYRNNAHQANKLSGIGAGQGNILLTADPFTNRAGRVYSYNTTAGGGAALRATGWPNTWPAGTTVGYKDVGPIQHQDSGSSGLLLPLSREGGR